MGISMETVLIVEDEATTRDALLELLGKEGREIVTAGDGAEALKRLMEVPHPRVILLDLMMPRMNRNFSAGNRAIRRLPKFLPSCCPAPSCQPEQKHQLTKPVDVDRLRALVDQYC
jgi:CheY-like chemotaxis protein